MKDFRLRVFLFIEKLSLLQLTISFVVIVLLFGLTYSVFTPGINGIITFQEEEFNFWNGLYFSIVTITTLGYGDMKPMGLSKLFSVIEVILGLVLMGMLVAKLTSSRLSYHVKRLYISDSHRQLYVYQSKIRTLQSGINDLIQTSLPKLIETPSGENTRSNLDSLSLQNQIRKTFLKTFSELAKVIEDLKSYINTEVKSGDYFSEISVDLIKELGNTISEIVNQAHQFLIGISEEKRARLLFGDPGKNYSGLLTHVKELCGIIIKYSRDNQAKLTYSTIETRCNNSENDIIIVAVSIYDINPPDQRDESSTELKDN